MTITKTFVQEGFNWDRDTEWTNVDMTYEELIALYNNNLNKYGWMKAREIVKTFDYETLTITEKVTREAQVYRDFDRNTKEWTNWYIKEKRQEDKKH